MTRPGHHRRQAPLERRRHANKGNSSYSPTLILRRDAPRWAPSTFRPVKGRLGSGCLPAVAPFCPMAASFMHLPVNGGPSSLLQLGGRPKLHSFAGCQNPSKDLPLPCTQPRKEAGKQPLGKHTGAVHRRGSLPSTLFQRPETRGKGQPAPKQLTHWGTVQARSL